MFTTALFTMANTWKQSKCPSADEWIKKNVVYTHTMEYYLNIKKWNFANCRNKDRLGIMLSEKSQTEKDKFCGYHLQVEYKKYNKLVIKTKKQTYRYREQTSSYKSKEVRGRSNTGTGD